MVRKPASPDDNGLEKRTSLTLDKELFLRLKASGLKYNEVIRRGLDALDPDVLTRIIREAVAEELDARGLTGKDRQ